VFKNGDKKGHPWNYTIEYVNSVCEKILSNVTRLNSELKNELIDPDKIDETKQQLNLLIKHSDQKLHNLFFELERGDRNFDIFKCLFLDTLDKFCYPFSNLTLELKKAHEKRVAPEGIVFSLLRISEKYKELISIRRTTNDPRFYSLKELCQYLEASGDNPLDSAVDQRIFLLEESDIDNLFYDYNNEINTIIRGNSSDLPKGMGGIFQKGEPIPYLYWMLEWHYMNYWQPCFCNKNNFIYRLNANLRLNGHDLLTSSDLLLLKCKNGSGMLCFTWGKSKTSIAGQELSGVEMIFNNKNEVINCVDRTINTLEPIPYENLLDNKRFLVNASYLKIKVAGKEYDDVIGALKEQTKQYGMGWVKPTKEY
jgi:hypothetical protein